MNALSDYRNGEYQYPPSSARAETPCNYEIPGARLL